MNWRLFIFFCLSCGTALAAVQVRISEPNSLQEINLTEIMVGSHVSLVVYSDANYVYDYSDPNYVSDPNSIWSGGFFIEGQDRAVGQLQARDKDPNSRDWLGSHLEAAGELAHVWEWNDSNIWGFDMYPDDFESQTGDWFVIDYYALDEGQCSIGIYNHSDNDWTIPDPNVSLVFLNTPTRDLYFDGFVNYVDFAIFSSYWEAENCSDPNNGCYQADFSRNGYVGLEDVMMFADFWLWGNPGWKPAEEIPEPNIVHDVTYAIVDANSLSAITLEVGQSITLYIIKSSSSETVNIFDMDVMISDPNWGWIDNAETGTAEILATPRMEDFDYIGPAEIQAEGIGFLAANIGSPILDGDMASFVYTATDPNDVTLSLTNYSTDANLESIRIHQILPAVEMLQQAYAESPELQESIPQVEWDAFIESVEVSQ